MASGIGHLIADRHLWALGGHTVQRRAAALQAKWRVQIRQQRAFGSSVPVKGVSAKGVAKPFAGYGTKTFLYLVRSLEKEAKIVSPDSDLALCRAVAVKAVLLGFTCLGQLAGTLEADVLDFIPSPATRALLMRMVAKATENHTAFKKRKDFVLDAQASSSLTMASGSSSATSSSGVGGSATSSASVGGSAASAEALSSTVKTLDAEQLQISRPYCPEAGSSLAGQVVCAFQAAESLRLCCMREGQQLDMHDIAVS